MPARPSRRSARPNEAENHTYTLEGVEGTVFLTDTPGLSEIGEAGSEREREARDLAARADLLVFVLDHDLVRTEYEPLAALVRQGKRSIVVLNKTDRFTDADAAAILAKLKERLRGLVPADDIVAAAAAPRPLPVRAASGRTARPRPCSRNSHPTCRRCGPESARSSTARAKRLRAGNLLLRAHLLSRKAQEQLAKERDERANDVIEKFQWITAGTVFANPFPALELVANGAVQFQMISELAGVYGVQISTSHVRMIGGQMIQMLLKLGLVETATSLIAGIFKSTSGRLRRGGGRAGRLDGLSDARLGRSLRRVFSGRPDLGRRRHAGRLGSPVRPDEPGRVSSGIRQAGRAESLEPIGYMALRKRPSSPRPRSNM